MCGGGATLFTPPNSGRMTSPSSKANGQYTRRSMTFRFAIVLALAVSLAPAADLQTDARDALKKAVGFYRQQVSTEGGYHFSYATDLSYGRSEHAQGRSQASVQRDGTPSVGMAFLDAWEATADKSYLDAATDAARALIRGQFCSGGWTYIIEFDAAKRSEYAYRADKNCGAEANLSVLDDNNSKAAVRLLMRVDRELDFEDEAIHEVGAAIAPGTRA